MSLLKKLEELEKDVHTSIQQKVLETGKESQWSHEKVMNIRKHNFTLPNGRPIAEISVDNLIDLQGYTYRYYSMEFRELCRLADLINEPPEDQRDFWGDDNDLLDQDMGAK